MNVNKLFKFETTNKEVRDQWLKIKLNQIPAGSRILDAGAGELRNKPLCSHLNYVSQDFGQLQAIIPMRQDLEMMNNGILAKLI